MTPFDLEVLRPYLRPKFMSMEMVDFLEIVNNSRTRNENFDKFFDLKEPEYNIFGPIPKHSKITVFHFILAPRPKSSLTKMLHKILDSIKLNQTSSSIKIFDFISAQVVYKSGFA